MQRSVDNVADLLLALALATKPCPGCDGGIVFPCHHCGSTGQVVKHPMLRVPCPPEEYRSQGLPCRLERRKYEVNRVYTEKYTEQDWLNHCWCQGRGWLPVSGPEATDALLVAGKPWQLGVRWNDAAQLFFGLAYVERREIAREGNTPPEALALALCKAEKLEVA